MNQGQSSGATTSSFALGLSTAGMALTQRRRYLMLLSLQCLYYLIKYTTYQNRLNHIPRIAEKRYFNGMIGEKTSLKYGKV